ncbi:hypothetical protein [Allohahella marinimesophila]|uniref:Pimeloyl-ACP methyl ester carboxylesterase n=1 Tax=Allohahella marinimesophila TaxID=1054972 RepID=A0ABP7PNV3_9GAMM
MSALQIIIVGGWAQTTGSYGCLANALEKALITENSGAITHTRIQILPLESSASTLYSQLDLLASACREAATPVLWLGCSLGGLHLLQWLERRRAGEPDLRHAKEYLVLFGTNPRFCESLETAWPGMPAAALDTMFADLAKDQSRTIRAFNMLQCSKLPGSRRKQALKMLNDSPASAPSAVLEEGLQFLRREDLRASFASSPILAMALFGELDPLTGESVAKASDRLVAGLPVGRMPRPTVTLIPHAGHYPDELSSASIATQCKDFIQTAHPQDLRLEAHG